jgi:chaperonin GroES
MGGKLDQRQGGAAAPRLPICGIQSWKGRIMPGFRPLQDRVMVRRIEAKAVSEGGIIIPDTAKEKPIEGEVLAVGQGTRDDTGKLVPPEVKTGDHVLFGKWAGTEVLIEGADRLILKESDILGIFER